jgi:multiple sugar transport system permease protein
MRCSNFIKTDEVINMLKTEPGQAVMRHKAKLVKMENLAGYTFVLPMLLGLTIFTIIPAIFSLILSFTNWSFIAGIDKIKFNGILNYTQLFHDQLFLTSFKNNLVLLLVVPVQLILSLILAVIVDKFVYFKSFFKVVFFMPYVSSIVAVSIVFQLLFQPSYGPVNQILKSLGVAKPPLWLADIHYALPSVMIIMTWIGIGFCLIVYLAALQSIPRDLYESADIDGAGAWTRFSKITLPLVSQPPSFCS